MSKNYKIKTKSSSIVILFSFIFATILFLTSLTIYVNTIVYSKDIDKTLAYSERGYLNHSVCLNDNEYINEKCITENKSFVTSLIEKINTQLRYEIEASDFVNYTYGYSIKLNVIATEKGSSDKVLYEKEEVLKEKTDFQGNTNFIVINESIPINFQKYNDIILSFKKNYILAVDSTLSITATINVIGQKDGIEETINNSYTFKYSMPLAEQTVNISDETLKIDKNNILVKYKDKAENYKYYKLFEKVLYIIDSVILVLIICILLKLRPKKRDYDKEVDKILKSYDDIIVSVKKMPDLSELDVIEVEVFNELLDAKEALNRPIIYYESSHKDCSVFIIYNEKDAYIYVVSAYKRKRK